MEAFFVFSPFICAFGWLIYSMIMQKINGTYPVSKEVSELILSFIDDEKTEVLPGFGYYKIFKNGEFTLSVWNRNYPYAIGNEGTLEKNGKIIKSWYELNPSYTVRHKIRHKI